MRQDHQGPGGDRKKCEFRNQQLAKDTGARVFKFDLFDSRQLHLRSLQPACLSKP
jgi:hypothetical protein